MAARPNIRPSYAFVVDGETEIWYLNMLKRNEKHLQIAIRPELAQKKSLQEQFNQVCLLSEDYPTVFWVVDIDTYIRENRENPRLAKIRELADFKSKIPENVVFIANTPCFEIWILLHLMNTGRYFDCCDAVIREIRKHKEFSSYEKTQRYFTQGNDIYKRLRQYLSFAKANASRLPEIDFDEIERGVCQMYKIFDVLKL